jgi:hypothetical protein
LVATRRTRASGRIRRENTSRKYSPSLFPSTEQGWVANAVDCPIRLVSRQDLGLRERSNQRSRGESKVDRGPVRSWDGMAGVKFLLLRGSSNVHIGNTRLEQCSQNAKDTQREHSEQLTCENDGWAWTEGCKAARPSAEEKLTSQSTIEE